MAEEAPESKEECQARWWREWWQADYSWDGLAKKAILGGGQWGEETLQEYWRRDPATGKRRTDAGLKRAGELIEFAGRWWHLAHLPPRARTTGQTSWKAEVGGAHWPRLSAIFSERLALAKETPGEHTYSGIARTLTYMPRGADNRARFDGAVIRTLFPSSVPSSRGGEKVNHVDCCRVGFLAPLDCRGETFGPGTRFDRAAFYGEACFDEISVSGEARFAGAKFSEGAGFNRATFGGGACFDDAEFSEVANFMGATFSERASFKWVTFSEGAAFNQSTFIGDVDFRHATFRGYAVFDASVFHGEAGFSRASFSGHARFYASTFSGNARFREARFFDEARFIDTTFASIANFSGVSFTREAYFDSVTFCGRANFDNATFEERVSFGGPSSQPRTEFEKYGSFQNTIFKRPVVFEATVQQPELGFAGSFYGARFADIADFSNSGPLRSGAHGRNDGARMAIALAEALFEKTLILTDGADDVADKAFLAGLATILIEPAERREYLLDRLEAGSRTVKIAMGKARDEAREQRYYRFQLQARHARADTPIAEKLFGRLYGVVSGYGGSLGRPLVWLGILIAVSALLYWLLASALSGDTAFSPFSWDAWAKLSSALNFSFSRSLFLSAWPGVPEKDVTTWQHLLLNGYGAGWGLAVRALAALQSILSGILIFLFALAVRRKFQIGG